MRIYSAQEVIGSKCWKKEMDSMKTVSKPVQAWQREKVTKDLPTQESQGEYRMDIIDYPIE